MFISSKSSFIDRMWLSPFNILWIPTVAQWCQQSFVYLSSILFIQHLAPLDFHRLYKGKYMNINIHVYHIHLLWSPLYFVAHTFLSIFRIPRVWFFPSPISWLNTSSLWGPNDRRAQYVRGSPLCQIHKIHPSNISEWPKITGIVEQYFHVFRHYQYLWKNKWTNALLWTWE